MNVSAVKRLSIYDECSAYRITFPTKYEDGDAEKNF